MSWKTTLLGSVLKTRAGGTPLKSKKEYYEGGDIPWLMSGEVCTKDIYSCVNKITQLGVENSSAKLFPANTTLVAMYGATAGQVGILRFPATTNQAVCGILPCKNYLPEFLYYYLSFYKDTLLLEVSGVAQPNLSQIKIKNIPIPLISVKIQQKIVAKLDAIFAEIDTATAAAEANANNAEALFQSYLTEIFERGGEGWLDKIINDVCSNITDGKHGDCANQENSGYYFLSAKDIKNGILNYTNARQITKNDFEETHRRTNLEDGDVLVTNSGTIGRMAIATNQIETTRTTFQKSVAILKPIKKEIDNKFLFHLLTSKLIHFNNISAGAAQKNLLLRDIRSLKIKIPNSIDEQIKIAFRCDLVKNYSEEIKRCYLGKLDNINKLKNSILQKAFSGELVKD